MLAGIAAAQSPDGTLSGVVTHDGEAMPGVAVAATSPSMQGQKTVITGAGGDYILRFLPPGEYTVTFSLEGFKTLESIVKISAAQTRTLDAEMIPEAVTGEIEVTSAYETISSQTEGSVTYELSFLEELPVQRDMEAAVLLAPGTTVSTVTNGLSLAGAAGHESLYLVNGVDMREPISGGNLGLYIEDAIQETTVATSSISAEYGRFSGGIVNLLTKSGGNEFSGSFRVSLTNDSWTEETPVTVAQEDKINPRYEVTLGGRIVRDKVWFFLAARDRELDAAGQSLSPSPISFKRKDSETRYEAKLTWALTPSHRIIGSYLDFEQEWFNPDTGFPILDANALIGDASLTQDLWALNYTGVITPNFFLEAQYAERNTEQAGYGGKTPQEDTVGGTAVIYFTSAFENGNSALAGCGSCDPLTIEQQHLLVKGSYFLSTNKTGSHDLVFGVEDVTDGVLQQGAQTASGWWIAHLQAPSYDAAGNWEPYFNPGATVVIFNPRVFEATLSDYNTSSAYVNDTWRLNKKMTLNLGVRYDRTDGTDGLQTVADDQRWSPRFGLTWDLKGDGEWLMHAGLGRYTSYVNQTVGGFSGPGSLWQFAYIYLLGPPVAQQAPHDAIAELFDNFWTYQGGVQGTAFLTGNVLLPGINTIVNDLKTPYSDELTIGFTKRLGNRGLVRVDYVHREYHDFFAIKRDTTTGSVCTDIEIMPGQIINQCFDKGFFVNDDDSLDLGYDGLHSQFQYRFSDRWQIGGTWTWSHSIGNWAAGAAGSASESGNFGAGPHNGLEYPEYQREAWNWPRGDLPSDRRHKVRAWVGWDAVSSRRHNLNVSALVNFTSGFPYNAYARISIPPGAVENPGYYTAPTQIGYYYTKPDAYRTEDVHSLDLALNYSFFIPAGNTNIELFIQPEILNVFNQEGAVNVNNLAYPTGVFDPFTETPQEGVHWAKVPGFGEPQAENDYQQPRTFRVSFGIRF